MPASHNCRDLGRYYKFFANVYIKKNLNRRKDECFLLLKSFVVGYYEVDLPNQEKIDLS
jgi:hypothetical protein